MKKQLTERQLWQIWQNEYNRWTRAGFDITEAVRRADAAVAAKRTPMPEAVAEPDAAVKTS